MVAGLFIGATADAVDRALAGTRGTVAVVGLPRLARALAERGRRVVAIADAPRALRRKRVDGAYASGAALPMQDSALAAVVGVGAGSVPAWAELLREWSRVVEEGGAVVMVDRGARPELSRRALCGGLMDLEQRVAGRTVITRGLVAKIPG